MRCSLRFVGVLFGTAMWSLACAQSSGFVVNHRICKMATEQAVARSVPVGCGFFDVADGCATNSPLSLQLNFQAPAQSVARLELTNVPPGLQPSVGAEVGTVKRVDHDTLEIRPGLGIVSGFISDAAQVPVVSVTFHVPEHALTVKPNPWLNGPESAAQVRLHLTQVVGNHVADRSSITHFYYPCQEQHAIDQLRLDGLQSEGAVALLDARVAQFGVPAERPCASYDGYTGVPFITLPGLFEKHDCLERVAVFGNADAVAFRKAPPFWQDGDNAQVLPISMPKLTQQPLRIWVLYDPANMQAQADMHLQNATRIYREQFGGITFRAMKGQPYRELDQAVNASQIGCDDVPLLKQVPGFSPKQLNIFYVDFLNNAYGLWCGLDSIEGRNVILIASIAEARTLAHEIGHALLDSGNHADPGMDDFSAAHRENLMTGNAGGEQLTLGQLYRASLNKYSSVNRHGARPGRPQVTCNPDSSSPDSCPTLPHDVTPR